MKFLLGRSPATVSPGAIDGRSITAVNASPLNDGGAAVVLTALGSEERGDVLWRVHVRQLLARFTDFVAAVQIEFARRVSGVSAG